MDSHAETREAGHSQMRESGPLDVETVHDGPWRSAPGHAADGFAQRVRLFAVRIPSDQRPSTGGHCAPRVTDIPLAVEELSTTAHEVLLTDLNRRA